MRPRKTLGAGQLPRPARPARAAYGRTSYTTLNGVAAAWRNRVNPASVTTCRIAAAPASPACLRASSIDPS
jgi:hypothetical protein